MPQLIIPADQEFTLTVASRQAHVRVTEADPIIVTFKQANEATNMRRQELLARPISRLWEKLDGKPDAEREYKEQFYLTPYGQRLAVDIYLTMTSCNITDPKRQQLITGEEKTFSEFRKKWGIVWPEWAEVIYAEACLKVNPSWGGGSDNEDEDEAVLSVGEEEAEETAS
jgi:hypothetical protein